MKKENLLKKLIIELKDLLDTADFRADRDKNIEKAIELLEDCVFYIKEENH